MLRLFVLLIAFASGATRVWAEPVVDSVTILEHGTFKAKLLDRVPRAADPSGFANTLSGHQLIERTDQICARLGVRFGVTIRLEGKPVGQPVLLEIVNNYPPQGITNDKGQMFHKTRFPWLATIGQPSTIVFTFDETWEMAHGTWSYDIEYKGQKIGTRAFTVMTTCETS
jgi:Domain of unknown function (DUF3859)